MTYLVTAATGNAGGAVLRALRARDADVRAASRSPRTWPGGIEPVVADLNDPEAFARLARDVDGVFVMAGYPSEAALLAALPSDARVVLLSSSAAPSGDTTNPVAGYHVRSEQAVRASGRPWTILRPNSFMTNALRWSDELAAGDVVHAPFADIAVAAIDPADIGAVAAAALLDDGHADTVHRLSGPEALTPGEQLAILGDALGRELRLQATPDADVDATFVEIFRGGLADETTVHDTVARILGRPPGTFAEWARAHANRFA